MPTSSISPESNREAVAESIAGQLGFASFEALLSSPSEQPALLVVDNCEHVTAAAADAIDRLLAACQSPTVLATSRSPLDLPGESLVVLGPLGVPAPGSIDIDSDSVRLFVERATAPGRRSPMNGSMTSPNSVAIWTVCRWPSSWPRRGPGRCNPERSSPGSASISMSSLGPAYAATNVTTAWLTHRVVIRLLPDPVARMFDRLGVFAGPFTAALAYGVGADVGLDDRATADALQLLVDSSLVSAEPTADTTRFRLLETIKSFAVRRLDAQGTLDGPAAVSPTTWSRPPP